METNAARRAPFTITRCWLVLLAAVLPLAAPAGADEESRPPEIRDARRDGAGRVWGTDAGSRAGLYALDAQDHWQPAAPPKLPNGARPICLGLRADGAVVCLWRTPHGDYQCSEHRGQEARTLAPFSLPGDWARHETRLTGDSHGGMWLTQRAPQIYRLKPDGSPECLHTIAADECVPSRIHGPGAATWGTVSVCEDTAGRLWFWVGDAIYGTVPRGVLVYDGTNFVLHDFMLADGKKQHELRLLAPKDEKHFWLGVSGTGLYTLDAETFQAERVPDQPGEAAYTPLAVRGRHGDWLFVIGQTRPEGGGTLWRLGPDARWTKLIDGLDADFHYSYQEDRLWVWTEQGAYVGSNDNGLWFVPDDGAPPRRADWRQGFPLATPRGLIPLPDALWLGVSARGQTWVGDPAFLFRGPAPAGDPRVSILRTRAPLRGDPRGHLWSLFDNHNTSVREWDGVRWIDHPFPPGLKWKPYEELVNVDGRCRPWIRSSGHPDHTLTYDPAGDHWDVFDDFHQALEAQGGRHDAEFAPWNGSFDLSRFGGFDELPRFGPNGQICYLSRQGGLIDTFDGHAWRRWHGEEVTGRKNMGFEGAPFFNRAGQLCVNDRQQTLTCIDGENWLVTENERSPADMRTINEVLHPPLPPDLNLPFTPEARALDNHGAWWLVRRGALYKARDGLCVPVFGTGAAQPYLDGRGLAGALIDARGNAFLCGDDRNSGEYVIVTPAGPPPQTTLAKEGARGQGGAPPPANQTTIRLTTSAGPVEGKFRFVLQLDQGPWTALEADAATATVTLDELAGGSHHLEARSLDPTLQTDPTPAALTFETHLGP